MKALVTGSNGGLGRAIVARLREDGFDVVTMDMTEPADLLVDLELGEVPVEELKDIDVCVSNAGIVDILAPAHSISREKWDRDIAVNLTGAFRVIQACLRGMRERKYGRIVVMSSFAARGGSPGQVAYCASKAGLLGMAKNIAAENVALGITVNSILPGLIGTEKVRALPEDILDRFREGSGLLGRAGLASRGRSGRWSPSWPRPKRATSPARRSSSPAVATCSRSRSAPRVVEAEAHGYEGPSGGARRRALSISPTSSFGYVDRFSELCDGRRRVQISAALSYGPTAPFAIESIDLDDPRDDEILVRMVAAGVCHTDLGVKASWPAEKGPLVLGHEGAGIVEAVGDGVTTVAPATTSC